MSKSDDDIIISELSEKEYEAGFVTDIETEVFPPGLDEEVIRKLSAKKNEPKFMLDFRLKAFRKWQTMEEPDWAHLEYEKPDFQSISYYAAPKNTPKYNSLDEVDPELIKTFEKLGIPLDEQKVLSGVAVDVVMDSVSVHTTFKETLNEKGIIFCSISEAIQEHPELVEKYMTSVVPVGDNYYAALN